MLGFDWSAYDHFGLAATVLAGTLAAAWLLTRLIFSERHRPFVLSLKRGCSTLHQCHRHLVCVDARLPCQ